MLRLLILILFMFGCASKQPIYTGGAVAADHPLASQVGVDILAAGGNAVDAAVATSFALSVVRPFSCGLGGGGFMIIDSPTMEPVALNYRETAPATVGSDFFVTHDSRYGGTAVGIPGTVAGLLAAHERFGLLSRPQVLAPAIKLAREGFLPDMAYADALKTIVRVIDDNPHLSEGALALLATFNTQGRVVLKGQAEVFENIARDGLSGFYNGPVAQSIIDATGGHLSKEDLLNYEPRWESPLIVDIGGGHTLVSMPPPSSGGLATAQIIGMMTRVGGDSLDREDPLYTHLLVESMKHAFADRAAHLADAAFVDVPVDELLDDTYLDLLASRIKPDQTFERFSYGSITSPPDDDGTSHLCVVDADGMTVAATETINTSFGSLVLATPFDFALNNEMDDFSSPNGVNAYGLQQSDDNLPEPNKRPLSSMSPTIVTVDGRPVLVVGASGGPRIITGVVQVLLNILWFGDEPIEALNRPRIHHQWLPDRVDFEKGNVDPDLVDALSARGHDTGYRSHIGVVQVIEIDGTNFKPASDPRKGGQPAGMQLR